jgi:hypothetical protein
MEIGHVISKADYFTEKQALKLDEIVEIKYKIINMNIHEQKYL